VVYLGDYIDRGPDSASVLDLMVYPPPEISEIKRIHLIGNHEAFCLEAYDGEDDAEADWLENGGADCLQSWSLSADNWRAMAPPEHIKFLRSLALKHIQGGYMFVHAGIRPMVGIDDQDPDDILWIREAFLDDEGPHPFVVVHGHTPESMHPTVRYNRIGIDTGAAYGGPLTCLVLEGDQMGFLVSKHDNSTEGAHADAIIV
jgi:serine/threonine protein phosphatase 1